MNRPKVKFIKAKLIIFLKIVSKHNSTAKTSFASRLAWSAHFAMNGDKSGNLKFKGGLLGVLEGVEGADAPHWAVQTSSRSTASRGHSRRSCAQSVMRNDAHCA